MNDNVKKFVNGPDFIIKSILDNDLYKFTQQQAVLELYPEAQVEYRFKNRGDHRFNEDFLVILRNEINNMMHLNLSSEEVNYMNSLKFFKPSYISYLKGFKFNPEQVEINLDSDNDLQLTIKGPWHSTILWEVPLMALISELYFKLNDKWDEKQIVPLEAFRIRTKEKAIKLSEENVAFADFGTRRRRSKLAQKIAIEELLKANSFVGTSNVNFAMKMGLKPIGTVAHEFTCGIAAIESINRANYVALNQWHKVYNGNLGIALTDTYGTEAFFKDFDLLLSKLYDGCRHDSGCPFKFGEKVINHYKNHKIDPMSKTIVFSDGLNTDKAIELKKYFDGRIKTSFGIGTHMTNDFPGHEKPLNMVIKLWKANGNPVVKLSENPEKAMGEEKAIEMYRYVYGI